MWSVIKAVGVAVIFFLALRWLLRKIFGRRLGSWLAKLLIVLWLWALLAMADAIATPILWLAPGLYLPFGHPMYTWKALVARLDTTVGHGSMVEMALMHHIFTARPEPGFAVTQAPWVLLALAVAWRVLVGPSRGPTAKAGGLRA